MNVAQRRFDEVQGEITVLLRDWEKTTRQLGERFREVADNRWYELAGFSTMVDWGAAKYGLGKSRIHQLIDTADVSDDLEEHSAPWIPANERQARPLKRLKSDERVRVAKFLATEYEGESITEERVRAAVAEVAPWRRGYTAKEDVQQDRARKRLRRRVEAACITLAEEKGGGQQFCKLFGPPEGWKAALAFLREIERAEG